MSVVKANRRPVNFLVLEMNSKRMAFGRRVEIIRNEIIVYSAIKQLSACSGPHSVSDNEYANSYLLGVVAALANANQLHIFGNNEASEMLTAPSISEEISLVKQRTGSYVGGVPSLCQ